MASVVKPDLSEILDAVANGKLPPQDAAKMLGIQLGSTTYERLVILSGVVDEGKALEAMYKQQKDYENHASEQ